VLDGQLEGLQNVFAPPPRQARKNRVVIERFAGLDQPLDLTDQPVDFGYRAGIGGCVAVRGWPFSGR
jgi:hypothetical protein